MTGPAASSPAWENAVQQARTSWVGLPRFAIGTDASAAYQNAGMGNAWISDSSNPYLSGAEQLPPHLRTLVNAGFPVAPAVGASALGWVAPQLNTAAAVAQRGGGALPSLQALARQTKSETEATRGYYEGPVGIPWADIVDFLAKPTSHLRAAAQSRMAG
jgi:hypothetical protein